MSLDSLPKDPIMLLSFVNTRLRDDEISLKDFCAQFEVDEEHIKSKLIAAGYEYSEELNKFT